MFFNFFRKRHSRNTVKIILAAFPQSMKSDVLKVMEVIQVCEIEPHPHGSLKTLVRDQEIVIPNRVYFPEASPSDFKSLSNIQLAILAAIMTRHHSGYQREIWARVLCSDPSAWATPFLFFLLGDYVWQVLEVVHKGVEDKWGILLKESLQQNPKIGRSMNHRILNYWNLYYRREFPHFADYPGYLASVRLGFWDRKIAPNLIKPRKRA